MTSKLNEFNLTNTPDFTLNGYKTPGRVVSVYDGDTMTVILPVFGSHYKFKVRLSGIDTCEIKSKDPKLKELAFNARKRLLELVTRRPLRNEEVQTKAKTETLLNSECFLVWVCCKGEDKYGRLLCDVYQDDGTPRSFSQVLIDEKHAYVYNGETKLTEEQQVNAMN
jgi:endonuclease YncB( thermonuclease family)